MGEFDTNPEKERQAEAAEIRKGLAELDQELLRVSEWGIVSDKEAGIRARAVELKERLFLLLTEKEKIKELQDAVQEGLDEGFPVSIEEAMDDRFGRILADEELSPELKQAIDLLRAKVKEVFDIE